MPWPLWKVWRPYLVWQPVINPATRPRPHPVNPQRQLGRPPADQTPGPITGAASALSTPASQSGGGSVCDDPHDKYWLFLHRWNPDSLVCWVVSFPPETKMGVLGGVWPIIIILYGAAGWRSVSPLLTGDCGSTEGFSVKVCSFSFCLRGFSERRPILDKEENQQSWCRSRITCWSLSFPSSFKASKVVIKTKKLGLVTIWSSQ